MIVDDHAVFADALQARLRFEGGLDPIQVAYSADQGRRLLRTEPPDVLLLDLTLGGEDGLDLASWVGNNHPGCRTVMLTATHSSAQVLAGMRCGVRGWLPKTVAVGELVEVIVGVTRGEAWFPPAILGAVLPHLVAEGPTVAADPLATLTSREREVLQCLVDGLSRAQIAGRLHVSGNTVRTHTQNLLAKLGVHSTLEAVSTAMRHGLRAIDGGPDVVRKPA
jgi:DNA-binding NarL/FixJ family response regulator